MRQLAVGLISSLLLLFVCAGAAGAEENLRIGILPVLDTLPLQVAVQEGLFKEQGLDVTLVSFSSALERDMAIQSGKLDGYFGDMLNTLLLAKQGVPLRMLTVCYRSTPGQPMFGIALSPGTDAKALPQPCKVGISTSSIIEYLLNRMQRKPELREQHFSILEVRKIPIRLQMLLSGQLDSALLPEPLLSLAKLKKCAVLTTDEELKIPVTVVCLVEKALPKADAFMEAYEEAVRRINDDPEKYRALMVEKCRIPKPLEKDFPVYTLPEPQAPTENEVFEVQQWMLSRGLLDKFLPYDTLVP